MPDKEKITYEIDPHNRLIAKKTGKAWAGVGFREVLDGKFQVGDNNTLIYHVKKSGNSRIPQQIKFSGNYFLDKNHNLILTLDKWNNQVEANRLIITGQLLDVEEDELSFSVITKDSTGNTKVYILKLTGSWKADEYNRLTFEVTRENGAVDNLTLQGWWQINDNNQIIYTCANTLIFKGYWDITEKHRISYVLNKQINSVFDFQIGMLKLAEKGIEYKINIGAVPVSKKFFLTGEWKINERLGLLLEMPYKDKKVRNITFGAGFRLSKRDMLDIKLKTSQGQNLDIGLRLSRNILKDQGQAFMQALKEGKEVSLLAGIGFRW